MFGNGNLCGLLFGYGEKNSFLFKHYLKKALQIQAVSFQRFGTLSFLDDYSRESMRPKVTIENLVIPYAGLFILGIGIYIWSKLGPEKTS